MREVDSRGCVSCGTWVVLFGVLVLESGREGSGGIGDGSRLLFHVEHCGPVYGAWAKGQGGPKSGDCGVGCRMPVVVDATQCSTWNTLGPGLEGLDSPRRQEEYWGQCSSNLWGAGDGEAAV